MGLKEQIEKTKVENEMKSNDLSQSDGQKLQVQIKQYLDYVKQIGHELQSELLRYAQHSGNGQQMQQLQTQKMQINSSIDRVYALASNAISIGSSTSNNANVNDSNEKVEKLEEKVQKQEQEIKKLKGQKRGMVKMFNDKMRDVEWKHQQQRQNWRKIQQVTEENAEKKYNALMERSNQNNDSNEQHK